MIAESPAPQTGVMKATERLTSMFALTAALHNLHPALHAPAVPKVAVWRLGTKLVEKHSLGMKGPSYSR